VLVIAAIPAIAFAQRGKNEGKGHGVQLGPRPFFLVDDMKDEAKLKNALRQCKQGPFFQTDFSIGHRGAALQFPD
jgi:glycerophosphoryl diester phosphodiesterase